AKDKQGNPLQFSPTGLHGATEMLGRSGGGWERAFVFVPETPMVSAAKHVGPGPDDFQHIDRLAGSGIRLFIAVHELIHVCGPSNAEHNSPGPGADVFTNGPQAFEGAFDKPEDDKILLWNNPPLQRVFAPPITLKKKVIDLIQKNWK